MYLPPQFEITDPKEIHSFIEANAFGQLISTVEGRLFSTHMPFLVNADCTLLAGHLAKPNPQLIDINDQEVLITLDGAHDYISPSWYTTQGVPTWNYQTAHIYGICKRIDEPQKITDIIHALTAKYEAGFASPWQPSYPPAALNAIVGLEIKITQIQCKFKLSQNRSLQDRTQVIEQLEQRGSRQLAEAMRKIFPSTK
ncbi:FMN-binding negative transcriptional regulator [Cellvibrio sp. OA-2007]|uniref:FMN-binding negative transcriptional regulator n=1 Tax=Cellvibrio sp. OA-2007 TaxID=529823 RepID=UPI000781DB10|nr:FMN-binding negative transcriptional regulator [Cellvibrio sp. OA-2007]